MVDVKPLDESTESSVETATNQPDVFVHNDGSVTVGGHEYHPTTVATPYAGRPSKQPESRETFDDGANRDVDADVGVVNTGSPEELESSNENEITNIDDHYEVKNNDVELLK